MCFLSWAVEGRAVTGGNRSWLDTHSWIAMVSCRQVDTPFGLCPRIGEPALKLS
jgi:hypothetical protein